MEVTSRLDPGRPLLDHVWLGHLGLPPMARRMWFALLRYGAVAQRPRVRTGVRAGGRHPLSRAGHGPVSPYGRAFRSTSAVRAAPSPHMPWTPPPGWRGRRAQIDPLQVRAVRVPARRGPQHGLAEVGHAPVDVPADVVGVVRLELGGGHRRAGEDEIPKPGCEPLDLGLDALGHVDGRPRGHVAVAPQGVTARPAPGSGRPRPAWATRQNGRSAWRPASTAASLLGDLLEGSRRRARSPPPGTPRPPRGPAPTAPSRPCRPPVHSGTARAAAAGPARAGRRRAPGTGGA